MKIFLLLIYDYITEQLASAPWKGILVVIPTGWLSMVETLTAGFRLGAAFLSFVIAALTVYSFFEKRIKKAKGNDQETAP